MIKEMWGNLFKDFDGISEEDTDEIIHLLMRYQIDPLIFLSNYMAIETGDLRIKQITGLDLKRSESIPHFAGVTRRPMNQDCWWAIAAFPDVAYWWQTKRSNKTDLEKLFKDPETAVAVNSVSDLYKTLIPAYLSDTGRTLEASCKGLDNIYVAEPLLDSIGTDNNLTLIASFIGKFYRRLKCSYGHRFFDESTLLTAAGVLDLRNHIFLSHSVSIDQVKALANTTAGGEPPLIDFVMTMVPFVLSLDTDDMSLEGIIEYCKGERRSIVEAALDEKENPAFDVTVSKECKNLMEAPEANEARSLIGITEEKSDDSTAGGIGRLTFAGYSFLLIVYMIVMAAVLETRVALNVASFIAGLAGLWIIILRYTNIGSRHPWVWAAVSNVPVVALWIVGRCLYRPAGYRQTKQMDKAGKIVFWIYWLGVVAFFALGIFVVFVRATHNPGLLEP